MPSYRSRYFGGLMKTDNATTTLVKSEHGRWLAEELKKNVRARYAGVTVWAWANTARKTSVDVDSKGVNVKTKTMVETTSAHGKRTANTLVGETVERKRKRKASNAADSERAASKIKRQHVSGILKVPGGGKGVKQVRWCTSVQEPRETVRPKIVRVSCPDPTPTPTPETLLANSRRAQNLAKFPAMATWIDQLKVPIGKSLEFEDLPDVRPREAKPKKPMVLRYSDDHAWNRKIVIPPWDHRHALYHTLLGMHRGLNRRVTYMAKRGAPMAQLLEAARA